MKENPFFLTPRLHERKTKMLEIQEKENGKREEADLPEKKKVADVEAPEESHRTEHNRNGKTSSKHGERV